MPSSGFCYLHDYIHYIKTWLLFLLPHRVIGHLEGATPDSRVFMLLMKMALRLVSSRLRQHSTISTKRITPAATLPTTIPTIAPVDSPSLATAQPGWRSVRGKQTNEKKIEPEQGCGWWRQSQ
jgi:hypothetical protein